MRLKLFESAQKPRHFLRLVRYFWQVLEEFDHIAQLFCVDPDIIAASIRDWPMSRVVERRSTSTLKFACKRSPTRCFLNQRPCGVFLMASISGRFWLTSSSHSPRSKAEEF